MIIETEGLRKTFAAKTGYAAKKAAMGGQAARPAVVEAVAGVDLRVGEGEVFGFLGPNGAGKTTTVRMLVTLLAPDGGRATVAGCDLLREPARVRERIGYVGQAGGVDLGATARRNLLLQAQVHGLAPPRARARTAELLERFELGEAADRPARTLSGGQLRRLALAVGLAHQPPLLFLDEPTLGLDPLARMRLWDEVRGLRATGATVFLTTHYLDEADALCDRLAIIDGGRIVAEGTPEALKQEFSGDVVRLEVRAGHDNAEVRVRELPFVRTVQLEGDALRAYVEDGERAMPALLRILDERGLGVEAVTLSRPSLDDVFLHRTGRSLREESASL
jgi:ABC-2 type transport system ATP-binding protein